ncbi:MAG TPA: short-chain dehydrogenase, partial [Myxococcota bacterium]|nr:short-chain dehydrogenase [Myxococcota bacterium]
HEIFDVGGGRYARIFIGMGKGWMAPKGRKPTADDIFDHIDVIRDTRDFVVPASIAEETGAIIEALKSQQ